MAAKIPRRRRVSKPSKNPTSPATRAPIQMVIQGERPGWTIITGEVFDRIAEVYAPKPRMAAKPKLTTLMYPAVKSKAAAWAARNAPIINQRIICSWLKGDTRGRMATMINKPRPSGLKPMRCSPVPMPCHNPVASLSSALTVISMCSLLLRITVPGYL